MLREAVEHHPAALDDLGRLSREADNSNAAMAAGRARAQVAAGLVKLLADAGVVPSSARAWDFVRRSAWGVIAGRRYPDAGLATQLAGPSEKRKLAVSSGF